MARAARHCGDETKAHSRPLGTRTNTSFVIMAARLRPLLAVVLCFLLTVAGRVGGVPKLELASVLFRHGDRSPVAVLPVDRVPESAWPQGLGQLSVVGMQQQYYLGQLFRQRYVTETYRGFLTENYTRTEVYVRSTDYDRTLMSAGAQIAALFPPGERRRFNEGIQWQPIPIHTQPKENDTLLRGHIAHCPRFNQLHAQDMETEEYQSLEREYASFFKRLANHTGFEVVNLTNVWSIEDTLFVENASGYGLPPWVQEGDMESLRNLSSYTLGLRFNTPEELQITAGAWVSKVHDDMMGKAAGDPALNDSKLFLYSAHDTTVANMLIALGVWDGMIPHYTAAFLVELFSDEDEYFIKMFYRNDTFSSEFLPVECGGRPQCSLEQFQELTAPLFPAESWQTLCGLDVASSAGKDGLHNGSNSSSEDGPDAWMVAAIVLAIILAGVAVFVPVAAAVSVYLYRNPKKTRIGKYIHLPAMADGASSTEDEHEDTREKV